MTHGAHSEAVSFDYMGSELAYTCGHMCGDRLATKDKQHNKTTTTHNEAGLQIGLQATHQIV